MASEEAAAPAALALSSFMQEPAWIGTHAVRKKTPRQIHTQAEPGLTEPFENFAEPPELQWPPNPIYAREAVQLLYEDYFSVKIPPWVAEILGKNAGYRIAYPEDRIDYIEAVSRAHAGDDETLLKLVRLFGHEVEENDPLLREHFHARVVQAHQERDFEFLRRYDEARQTPVRYQTRKQHIGRIFLLTIFEPILRNQKRQDIMAFLRAWHDAGRLPPDQLFPSLNSLKTYLSTRLGWSKKVS